MASNHPTKKPLENMAGDAYQGFAMGGLVTPMGSEDSRLSQGNSEFSENGPALDPSQQRTIAIITANLRHLYPAELDEILAVIVAASQRQYRAMAAAATEAAQADRLATEPSN